MGTTRWARVKEALAAQLEADETERALLLERTRKADPSLAHEVESILAAWDSKADFLEEPPFRAGPSLALGSRLGHYEVISLLGSGGMGEVYRALDLRLGRQVALKVLPPRWTSDAFARGRFEREAKAVAALSNPSIVALYDFDLGPPAYAVAELLEGQTLGERLLDGPLPVETALRYARQIAEGLAAAHRKGIVHRDLKPANLFVTREDRVKILDFGLAKHVWTLGGGDGEDEAATGPGLLLGTVGYMSPEQVRGQPVGAASDVFSFGAVLYEALTGRPAFRRASPAETLTSILRDEPLDMYRVPASLRSMVRGCLQKQPQQRIGSGSELLAALNGAPSARRRAIPTVAVAAGLLVLTGALFVTWTVTRGSPHPAKLTSDPALTFRTNPQDGAAYSLVPAGTFTMGCVGRPDCTADRQAQITFERPFWMMRTEVTVKQFAAFTKATARSMPTPPSFNPGWKHEDHPINNVTWFDARDYCAWAGGRLPSDAEWERSARATHDWPFEWGPQPEPLLDDGRPAANLRDEAYLRKYGDDAGPNAGPNATFRDYDDGYAETAPVASFPPNDLGLFDMTGNVSEWVEDTGLDNSKEISHPRGGLKWTPRNGRAWEGGDEMRRVLRPSNWKHGPGSSHVYDRAVFSPYGKASVTGFRCARDSAP